jgi:hypothetical protein
MYEFLIADRILLESGDLAYIAHYHGHLGRLGSWCCADIEYSVSGLGVECEDWEHARYRLEIDPPVIECICPLHRVVILMIEEIDVRKSSEWCYSDSFLGELSEHQSAISCEKIDTKGSLSLSCEYLYDIIIISTKESFESRCEKFWKQKKKVIE